MENKPIKPILKGAHSQKLILQRYAADVNLRKTRYMAPEAYDPTLPLTEKVRAVESALVGIHDSLALSSDPVRIDERLAQPER